jgi:hypothetical protein
MKTVSQRLARYGLQDREAQLTELRVVRGTRLHLTLEDPEHRQKAAVLRVKSAAELKQWLGVPNGAVAQDKPAPKSPRGFVSRAGSHPFVPYPKTPLRNPGLNADLMSYLLRDTTTVTPGEVEPLNNYMLNNPVNIAILLFADIFIDNESTLVIDTKIQTLFAGNIFIGEGGENPGGTLEMQSPVASIDCFGISSFPGL